MFAYCLNNPVLYSDNSGSYARVPSRDASCFVAHPAGGGGTDLDGGTANNLVTSIKNSIYSLVDSVAKNINISGGIGLGLYVEGEVSEIGVGLGTYYDFIAFEWQNGKLSTYECGYAGITGSVLVFDVGAEISVLVDEVNTPIIESWLLYNNQQDAIGIFGVALYTPLFGGRFAVNLDWVGLYRDLGWMQ